MITEKPIKADISHADNKLYLYGTIGDDWDGVTLDEVKNTVQNMDKSQVTVYINSYGGDATEGVAIRNFLSNAFTHIDVVVEGIAASSASIIATCGETLTMPTGTTYMIHNPWTIALGNSSELLREVKSLESLEQSYRNIYMERFAGTEEELTQLMDDESWLTADEAVSFGFADKTIKETNAENPKPEEKTLVATLLSKYAAKVEPGEGNEPNGSNEPNEEDDKDPINENKEPKANNFLMNFIKNTNIDFQKGE